MNQNAINYLKENKEKFSQDILVEQLKKAGYSEADIQDSVQAVYLEGNGAPAVEQAVQYAGFWIRAAAIFVDNLIVSIGVIIIFAVFIFGLQPTEQSFPFPLFAPLLVWCYFVGMTYKYQATLGKKMLGLKVVTDSLEAPSLGKVILREIIGRILTQITLQIGYLMAAFTQRKRGLHDMVAGTVVVYAEPNKKRSGVVTAVVIVAAILLIIVIVGIFTSVVLVSLNSARQKAQDTSVKASISMVIPDAIIYADENDGFTGYQLPDDFSMISCSGSPKINISEDGQEIAIFGKYCSDNTKYFCADTKTSGEVTDNDGEIASGKKTSCN